MVPVTPDGKVICYVLCRHRFIIFANMVKKLPDDTDIAPQCAFMSTCRYSINTISLHQPFVIVIHDNRQLFAFHQFKVLQFHIQGDFHAVNLLFA